MNFKGLEKLFIPLTAHFTNLFNGQRLFLFVAFLQIFKLCDSYFTFILHQKYYMSLTKECTAIEEFYIWFVSKLCRFLRCNVICYRQVYETLCAEKKWKILKKEEERERNNISIISMMSHI